MKKTKNNQVNGNRTRQTPGAERGLFEPTDDVQKWLRQLPNEVVPLFREQLRLSVRLLMILAEFSERDPVPMINKVIEEGCREGVGDAVDDVMAITGRNRR